MARITVEDCLKKVDNRFALIHLAAKRVRQLRKGAEPLVICKNKDIVVSLREIAADKVVQLNSEEGYEEIVETDPDGSGLPEPSLEADDSEEEKVEQPSPEDE